MANKNIVQPITDDSTECSQYYKVEYKLSTETAYNTFNAFDSPITIANVLDASVYDVRITRYCCNGGVSAPLILSINTTSTSPVLDPPGNFTLAPSSPAVSGELAASWDTEALAEQYYLELSKDIDFIVLEYTAIVDAPTITHDIPGLDVGILYYGRVKSRASGYADSDWSNTDSAVVPA